MSSRPVRRSRPAAVLALATALLAVVFALAGAVRGTADGGPAPSAGGVRTGFAAPAGAGEGTAPHGPPSPGFLPAVAASPQGGDAPARAVARAASAGSEPGPACGPGSGRDGVVPVVPSRGGHEHVSVLAARPAPEGVRPYRAECVRVPVRGPGQRALGPVELSVMRV
ncbi:hypothetical protein ABZ743_02625 [Streptomyces sp. NPDC006662]|uniref:hypothetical protein n=1 Tax=Streptomyces sp. NPDC006662 TaxID=3156902 RepID=UPI0033D6D53F